MGDLSGQAVEVTITDFTNDYHAVVDANGSLGVVRKDSSGNTAPAGDVTARPVFVKVTDGAKDVNVTTDVDGKNRFCVDAVGKLQIVPSLANTTLQILWDRTYAAVNANEWQEVMGYTVPTGYNINILSFEAQSQFANEAARAVYKNIMGTFDCPTNTFTDGGSVTLPRFCTRLYVYVTSAIGSGSNETFTITYINEHNVSGRTATVTITKSSLVGTRLEISLQNEDHGIIDITNVTHSATGQAGVVQFGGYMELLYLTLTSNNTQYQSASIALGGIVIFEGETIYLQYLAGTKTSYIRRLNLLTTLVPF